MTGEKERTAGEISREFIEAGGCDVEPGGIEAERERVSKIPEGERTHSEKWFMQNFEEILLEEMYKRGSTHE